MSEPPSRLPRNVKLLGLASLLNDIASDMVFPLLPEFLVKVLRGNELHLGVIEGLADSVSSIVKLWSGGRSDQGGRRKGFIVFGYSLAALARPLIGLTAWAWQLGVLRVMDRLGKGVRSAPREAMIADSTAPQMRGRAFGFDRAMDHLGAAIGPLLAFWFLLIWPDHLATLFLLTLVPGAVVVALLLVGLSEPPALEPPRERVRLTLKPFDRDFRLFLLALVVFTLGNSSDAFLLWRARELGVPAYQLPVLWCLFHIVKSLSNIGLGRGVDRFGPRLFIFSGWLLYAAVYLAFGLATEAWQVWGLFLTYALFYGLTEPAEKTLVAQLVGQQRKGLAFGWYNFAIGIATLPASALFGALYYWFGPLVAFGWGAGLALLAVGLLTMVREPRE